jgi:FkbM family methyltransferase
MLTENIFNKTANDKLVLSLSNSSTLIYGAGNTGRDVYRILRHNDYQISGFIDNRYFNTVIENIDVLNLEVIKNQWGRYKDNNIIIIISIFNRDVDIAQIIVELKELGFKNIFTFIELYQFFEDTLKERFWLSNTQLLIDEQEKIQQIYELLADESSRKLFERIIKFRMHCDYAELEAPLGLDQQYFPDDLPFWTDNAYFVDAGAYDGDTVQLAIEKKQKIATLFCFEPDVHNFAKLVSNTRQFTETCVYQIPCGLWSESTTLGFDSSYGEGSHISETGSSSITVVALDDVMMNSAPTQIKMDIEGAELAALKGALKTISQYRPNLAICVYHKPKDLWEIPLYINSLNLNYKFYLRNYGFSIFETVLYCIK